jgi:hypothetical protein
MAFTVKTVTVAESNWDIAQQDTHMLVGQRPNIVQSESILFKLICEAKESLRF